MERRKGEQALPFDPGTMPPDATIVFVGRVHSEWKERSDCPKNMATARRAPRPAWIDLDPRYLPGLQGLERFSHILILTWLDRSRRDLVVQMPRHADQPRGVFSVRSPVRPNPIGLHVARMTSLDLAAGRIGLEAIDVLDGTPVIDVKPYFASTDSIPDAVGGSGRA